MTQKEIKLALDLHGKWLRGEEGGSRADLSRADLRAADLGGANLSEADLRRANLGGADLSEAKLREAKNLDFLATLQP